ncbi:hypothetical protein [Haloarchaeobius sp. TZWWS8]|uniref:hypothetical protein n=1 Tax=Haloarchaeobius sp. TZWWS8 TaxID=3446121 RepID=UPI003EB8DB68
MSQQYRKEDREESKQDQRSEADQQRKQTQDREETQRTQDQQHAEAQGRMTHEAQSREEQGRYAGGESSGQMIYDQGPQGQQGAQWRGQMQHGQQQPTQGQQFGAQQSAGYSQAGPQGAQWTGSMHTGPQRQGGAQTTIEGRVDSGSAQPMRGSMNGQAQGRTTFEETMTFPVTQSMQFFRNLGQLSMVGFNVVEQMQHQGNQLARSMLNGYLRSFDDVSHEIQQMAPPQMHVETRMGGQPPQGQPEYRHEQDYNGGGWQGSGRFGDQQARFETQHGQQTGPQYEQRMSGQYGQQTEPQHEQRMSGQYGQQMGPQYEPQMSGQYGQAGAGWQASGQMGTPQLHGAEGTGEASTRRDEEQIEKGSESSSKSGSKSSSKSSKSSGSSKSSKSSGSSKSSKSSGSSKSKDKK